GLAACVPGGRGSFGRGQPVDHRRRADAGADGAVLREPVAEGAAAGRSVARGPVVDAAWGSGPWEFDAGGGRAEVGPAAAVLLGRVRPEHGPLVRRTSRPAPPDSGIITGDWMGKKPCVDRWCVEIPRRSAAPCWNLAACVLLVFGVAGLGGG